MLFQDDVSKEIDYHVHLWMEATKATEMTLFCSIKFYMLFVLENMENTCAYKQVHTNVATDTSIQMCKLKR